ncbi:hypothetical protein ABGB12_26885 [Actinocorallia sp. B10E7]|uniref:hypothetical protein n=1 Tax=Actinocorallia sp. B10E7 TaxID=3153558 RepID=UPI00325F5380
MNHGLNLPEYLAERYHRLERADYADVGVELGMFHAWASQQPLLQGILEEAATAEEDLDVEAFINLLRTNRTFYWTSKTEGGRATLIWKWIEHALEQDKTANDPSKFTLGWTNGVSVERNLTHRWRDFADRVLKPLFQYWLDRINSASNTIYVLERYVRRVEWFERERLHAEATADTQKMEEVYDRDLRKFLFNEGINMPYSQAQSPAGTSDVLFGLDGDDPFVGEVKLLDMKDRGRRELGKGLHQAVQYAMDHGKSFAYLVIINLTGRVLDLPNESESKTGFPFVTVSGVRVYLVPVRALQPPASASKLGKARPIKVTFDELVDPDVEDDDAEV